MSNVQNYIVRITRSDRAAMRILIAALVLTLIFRLMWFIHAGHHSFIWDEKTYDGIGYRMSTNGWSMTNNEGKLTAFVGPTYPVFVALVYTVFGHNPQAVYILQILLAVLTTYLIYRIGVLLTASRIVSAVAALIVAAYIPLVQWASLVHTEILFTLLMAATIYFVLVAIRRKSTACFVVAGVMAGVTTLCRGSALPLPFFMVVLILMMSVKTRKLIAGLSLFLVVFLFTLSPWVVRNYIVFNAFVPGATEAGYVMWSGTYGEYGIAPKTLPKHILKYLYAHPNEIEQNTFYQKEAIKNIKTNPVHWICLSFRKFTQFWLNVGYGKTPSKSSIAIMFTHLILIILSIFSLKSIKDRLGMWILIAVLVNFTLVHMITIGLVRYAVPFVPYITILGVRGFFRLVPSLERYLSLDSSVVASNIG
ncbi:MAG: glycosyltransferase family 39 protein [Armatimonadota bacterium]